MTQHALSSDAFVGASVIGADFEYNTRNIVRVVCKRTLFAICTTLVGGKECTGHPRMYEGAARAFRTPTKTIEKSTDARFLGRGGIRHFGGTSSVCSMGFVRGSSGRVPPPILYAEPILFVFCVSLPCAMLVFMQSSVPIASLGDTFRTSTGPMGPTGPMVCCHHRFLVCFHFYLWFFL